MLGPQKLVKIHQEAKKKLPRQFFDSQEAKNDDSGPPRRREPKTGSQKNLIFDDFRTFFDVFWRGFCITSSCLHGTQKMQQKTRLTGWGVIFRESRKSSNDVLKTTFFNEKPIQKRGVPKCAQKPRFSSFFEGPKRLKTDHFEVKIASSTSNGTFLRLLKKFFGLLRKHSILHRFFKDFQAEPGVSDLR